MTFIVMNNDAIGQTDVRNKMIDIDGDGDFDALDFALLADMERDDEPGEDNAGCFTVLLFAVLLLDVFELV